MDGREQTPPGSVRCLALRHGSPARKDAVLGAPGAPRRAAGAASDQSERPRGATGAPPAHAGSARRTENRRPVPRHPRTTGPARRALTRSSMSRRPGRLLVHAQPLPRADHLDRRQRITRITTPTGLGNTAGDGGHQLVMTLWERKFVLPGSLEPLAGPRLGGNASSSASGAQLNRTDVRPYRGGRCCTLLLYLLPGCSNYGSDLWSYGDSNPRPLACHEPHTKSLTSAITP